MLCWCLLVQLMKVFCLMIRLKIVFILNKCCNFLNLVLFVHENSYSRTFSAGLSRICSGMCKIFCNSISIKFTGVSQRGFFELYACFVELDFKINSKHIILIKYFLFLHQMHKKWITQHLFYQSNIQ